MTKPPDSPEDTHPASEWSDEDLERVLTWFFAREIPAARQDFVWQSTLCGPTQPRPGAAANSRSTARPASRWLIALCLTAVVGSGIFLRRAPEVKTVASSGEPAWLVRLDTTSLPVETEQIVFAGDRHQFTQRSELRWISERYVEPATGHVVEWSAPELIIDVDPIAVRESDLAQ